VSGHIDSRPDYPHEKSPLNIFEIVDRFSWNFVWTPCSCRLSILWMIWFPTIINTNVVSWTSEMIKIVLIPLNVWSWNFCKICDFMCSLHLCLCVHVWVTVCSWYTIYV
jgi:hypothetical protein